VQGTVDVSNTSGTPQTVAVALYQGATVVASAEALVPTSYTLSISVPSVAVELDGSTPISLQAFVPSIGFNALYQTDQQGLAHSTVLTYAQPGVGPAGPAMPAMAAGNVKYAGGNISVAWTTFALLHSAASLTLTTGARRVLLGWGLNLGEPYTLSVDVAIDGVLQGGTYGLQYGAPASGNLPFSLTYLTDALTAGAHTFELMVRVDSNTAVVRADAACPVTFWVLEQPTAV
jgi:hypothetical protein